jgi:hypothetical protein
MNLSGSSSGERPGHPFDVTSHVLEKPILEVQTTDERPLEKSIGRPVGQQHPRKS